MAVGLQASTNDPTPDRRGHAVARLVPQIRDVGDHLPWGIAAVMVVTIVLLLLTVGFSVLSTTRALDDQAAVQSLAQVRTAQASLLARVRAAAIDYSKWDAAAEAAVSDNVPWLFDNVGSSATVGQVIQLAVISLPGEPTALGWTDDGVLEGQSDLLDAASLDALEQRLRDVPSGYDGGLPFFAWVDDDLYALAASSFEFMEPVSGRPRLADLGFLVMGVRMSGDNLDDIAESFLLRRLTLSRSTPNSILSLPLPGLDGRPVAYLSWDQPRPGQTALAELLPLLLGVAAVSAGLMALAQFFVQRIAQGLVEAKRAAVQAAATDGLTGLPNRSAFQDALDRPGRAAERAVIFLDINNFKLINDSLGHAAGDQAIVGVADRLRRSMQPQAFLARISGDEFAVLVSAPDAERLTGDLTHAVALALTAPIWVHGHKLQVRAAIGYAVQRTDSMTGDDLLRQADLAMYEAKRQGRDNAIGFTEVIERASIDASAIEQALRAALRNGGEFTIAYQPIIRLGGSFVRAEALARWVSPSLGSVSPDRFIPVAERSGLMVELGRHLLHLICDDLATHPDLRVSLNLSPLQLVMPDFLPDLVAELAQRGVNPARIEIELTESVLVRDTKLAAERLRALREAGFLTSLDDFGSGYSSIGYLGQIGFDTLKIDRSFVQGAATSLKRRKVLGAMIQLAHGFDLTVVAEGVETGEDERLLRDLGCDLAQGYLFDQPMPIRDLAARWLDSALPSPVVGLRDRRALPLRPGAELTGTVLALHHPLEAGTRIP